MKKVKFEGKLSLGKETVAKLNDEYMQSLVGGCPPPTCLLTNCGGITTTCNGATKCATFCQAGSCVTTCGLNNCQ